MITEFSFLGELSLWVIVYLHKVELWMEEGKRVSMQQNMASVSMDELILLIVVGGVTISWTSADAAVTPWSAWTMLEDCSWIED